MGCDWKRKDIELSRKQKKGGEQSGSVVKLESGKELSYVMYDAMCMYVCMYAFLTMADHESRFTIDRLN